jgi:hypothetical protein
MPNVAIVSVEKSCSRRAIVAPEQEVGIGLAGRRQLPSRDADEIVAPPRTEPLQRLRLFEDDRTHLRRTQPSPNRLAVKRVDETHRLAPTVGADRDQAVALQSLEDVEAERRLELAEGSRLAQRQQIDHGAPGRCQRVDAALDQLAHPSWRVERPIQAPYPNPVGERASCQGAEHELVEGSTCPRSPATAGPPPKHRRGTPA